MHWKIKSKIYKFSDRFGLNRILSLVQRGYSKRSGRAFPEINPAWKQHAQNLEANDCLGKVLEIGAGYHLGQNLFLSSSVQTQIVIDIEELATPEAINRACRRLSELGQAHLSHEIKNYDDLRKYGIKYLFPINAASLPFDDGFFDGVVSSNTFEHIPKSEIIKIMKEIFRLLRSSGVVSLRIDYSDHYAHTDKSISLLNFLKFDDVEWKNYNHQRHYQNRLRHYEYRNIFESSGFSIADEKLFFDEKNIPDEVMLKFSDKDDSWRSTAAFFLLKKNNGCDVAQ